MEVPTFQYSIANLPTLLQKFSPKMLKAQLGAADLQGHGPPSNITANIARRAIFVRLKNAFENWEAMQKAGR